MQRSITLFAVAFLAGIVGFVAGWGTLASKTGKRFGRVVAVSWGGASHAKAFYGAHIGNGTNHFFLAKAELERQVKGNSTFLSRR